MKDDTLAMELLKEQKTNAKRWFIAFLVVLGLWFATIGGFIVYLSLPEEISTTVEQQADVDNNSTNTLIGGDWYSNPTENH